VADFKYYVFDTNQNFTIEGLEFTPLAGIMTFTQNIWYWLTLLFFYLPSYEGTLYLLWVHV
jgi:hypothetical protein